ncbi:MAG TPA: hypothetical protein VNU64_16920 [Burkholderiales bacterium]|nr:hypothetical protein [Burkholderiales bacterium]
MFWRSLRVYLDPFVLFKSIAADADAMDYNRRNRRLLLAYARRWAVIGLACAGGMQPLAVLARAEPMLSVPTLGLEIGFSASVCMLLLSLAVYVVLGLDA